MDPKNTQLDPDIVNLAKAIRDVETKGSKDPYSTRGASGEFGAYQYTPDTWAKDAQKHGVDVPLEKATREQQNEVAYKEMADLKKQGYNVGQIASIWNSGKPDWKGNVGVNAKGVKYDTPQYVDAVAQTYQAYKKGQNPAILPRTASTVDTGGSGAGLGAFAKPQANAEQTSAQAPALPAGTNMPIAAPGSVPRETAPDNGGGLMSKIGSGLQSFGRGIVSPILGTFATPTQLAVAGINKVTGSNIEDPFKNGIPVTGLGNVDVSPLDLEKKAGDVAQTAALAIPGEGLLGAAGSGALIGAGSAMSGGKDFAETATQGAEGALLGAGTFGATKLLGAGINKIGGLISGSEAEKATQGLKDAYSSALNLNASERAFENKSGKDIAQVLMDNNAPLGRTEQGYLDASKAIPKLQAALDPLNEEAQSIVSDPQGVVKYINLEDSLNGTIKRLEGMKLDPLEKKAAIDHATKLYQAAAEEYGTDLTPDVAEKLKQALQSSAFKGKLTTVDKLRGNVTFLASDQIKGDIEKSIAGTDAGDVLKALNAKRSDLIDALKRLQAMDGVRLLKGGRLGNMAGGLKGTIVGMSSGLGLPGALAGDYFGSEAAKFLNDPANKLYFAGQKAAGAGLIPKYLGKRAIPVGTSVSKIGSAIQRGARGVGLLSNLIAK